MGTMRSAEARIREFADRALCAAPVRLSLSKPPAALELLLT